MPVYLSTARPLVLSLASCVALFCATSRGETPPSSRSRVVANAVEAQTRESRQAVTGETDATIEAETIVPLKRNDDRKGNGQKRKAGKGKEGKTKSSVKAKKTVQGRDDEQFGAPFFFLQLEQKTRRATPDVVKGLTTSQRFSRRLPPHWNEVGVTEEQKSKVYAVQERYFLELAQLEARMERLKQERAAAMLQILNPRQQERLEQILVVAEAKHSGEAVEIVFDEDKEVDED